MIFSSKANSMDLENKCLSVITVRGAIVGKLEPLQNEISQLKKKKQAVVILLKHKPVFDELKTLSGRKKSKFEKEHQEEIEIHNQTLKQLQEYFSDNNFPNVATLDKQISKKTAELDSLNKQYNEVVAKNKELEYCRQQLAEYIRQEQNMPEIKRKNMIWNDSLNKKIRKFSYFRIFVIFSILLSFEFYSNKYTCYKNDN